MPSHESPPPPPPVVIGVAGAIGSGKSAAADVLRDCGCEILRADEQARDLLDRADIRKTLVEWWGACPGEKADPLLDDQGMIRRARVADIIFGDDEQRRRLESLIHPIVVGMQRDAIAEAARRGAACVVIDAPLLFEAGLDRDCHAIIFIDAPRDLRLARVARTRGWGPQELDRREKSQAPLEMKRERSHYVVNNDADLAELNRRVRDVFSRIMSASG